MFAISPRFICLITLAVASVSYALASPCLEKFGRPAYKSRGNFCSTGELIEDAYNPGNQILCEEAEIDHMISLRQAWASGVCGDDLKRLANDPKNLRLTYWKTNRQKGYLSPDEFAKELPAPVRKKVLEDADVLMRNYGIKTREQAVAARMLAIATGQSKHVEIYATALGPVVRKAMTTSPIGNRVVVSVGKRAVGYTTAGAVGISVVMASAWAVDWLTSPSQDGRMKQRADYFENLLEGEK